MQIKIKFKEERTAADVDKKRLAKEVAECHDKLEQAHNRFFALKTEVEQSPLAVLRQELGQKQLEITEMHSRVKAASTAAEDYKNKFEQLKRDMITLKKQIDLGKEAQLQK